MKPGRLAPAGFFFPRTTHVNATARRCAVFDAVPRFYFDLLRDDVIALDQDGVLLPSASAAREEAAHTAVDMVKDRLSDDMADFVLAVRDERGETLFEVQALVRVLEHERGS